MYILGIESSCDETSVAILKDDQEILANVIYSQIDLHKVYGGVVPEVASRNHCLNISLCFKEAFKEARLKPEDIDLVSVTMGPGLIGALLVGVTAAKTFARYYDLPLIGVNHLAGHIYAASLNKPYQFPLIALLVSGGNSEIVYLKEDFSYEIIGETKDDAVGECYDKVARMLGLGYPGGPLIDTLAKEGNPNAYELPKPLLKEGYQMSFSGLKSASLNLINKLKREGKDVNIPDFCASFQKTVVDLLVYKVKKALVAFNAKTLVVGGGVSCNSKLRSELLKLNNDYNVYIPSFSLTTDNAAMIALIGYKLYKSGVESDLNCTANSNLALF